MSNAHVTCRYMRRNDEQCTGEAINGDPDSEIVLCQKHTAAVMRQVQDRLRHLESMRIQ